MWLASRCLLNTVLGKVIGLGMGSNPFKPMTFSQVFQDISAGCGPGRYMAQGVADSCLMEMSLLKDGFNIQQLKLPFAKEVTEVIVVTFCRWY